MISFTEHRLHLLEQSGRTEDSIIEQIHWRAVTDLKSLRDQLNTATDIFDLAKFYDVSAKRLKVFLNKGEGNAVSEFRYVRDLLHDFSRIYKEAFKHLQEYLTSSEKAFFKWEIFNPETDMFVFDFSKISEHFTGTLWGKLKTLQATADKNPSNRSVKELCRLYNDKYGACLHNFETICKKVKESKATKVSQSKVVEQFFQVYKPIETLLQESQAFDMAVLAIETQQQVSELQEEQRRQQQTVSTQSKKTVSTEPTQEKQDKLSCTLLHKQKKLRQLCQWKTQVKQNKQKRAEKRKALLQQFRLNLPEKKDLTEEINTWIEKIQGLTDENKAILRKILENNPKEITVQQFNEAMKELGMDVSKTGGGFMVKAVKGSFTFSYHPSHTGNIARTPMICVKSVKKFFENLGIDCSLLETLERAQRIGSAKKRKTTKKKLS